MTSAIILVAAGTMLILALVSAWLLGWANKAFHVAADPKAEAISAVLPGANCGGCGCIGCNEYAAAIVNGELPVNKCTVGGVSCATALAKILGVAVEQSWPYRPIVHCGAKHADRLHRREYRSHPTCAAANIISGVQGCAYGCLGLGDCARSCRFDAIGVVDGLATVDYHKCTGCGTCERACPRHIISMVPFKHELMLAVTCSNKDFGKDVRAVCTVGCLGCGACSRSCDLIKLAENLSRIDYENYQPQLVAAAVHKCPMKRLTFFGKPSAKDLAAVADKPDTGLVEPEFRTTVDESEWHG